MKKKHICVCVCVSTVKEKREVQNAMTNWNRGISLLSVPETRFFSFVRSVTFQVSKSSTGTIGWHINSKKSRRKSRQDEAKKKQNWVRKTSLVCSSLFFVWKWVSLELFSLHYYDGLWTSRWICEISWMVFELHNSSFFSI